MCSRPSSPPRSTKAPYSVRFLTTPVSTDPSSRCSSVFERFSFCSPSSRSLRETTMLPRFLFSLMTATSMVWPFMPSRLRMGRRSTCEPGRNALGFLVREGDLPLFSRTLVPHHVDLVTGLELRLALVIKNFRQGQHAFRLGADIDNNMRRRQLQHRALDHAIFTHRLFGFTGEILQDGGEIFPWL